MGFSGGGSNVLLPHTHDGTVAQDGGPLDFDNVTQADLTAGDVVYSDGTHLQRLAIGTPAQQLKVNAGATAPEYFTPAAASATWTELVNTKVVGASANIDVSWLGTYNILKIFFYGAPSASAKTGITFNSDNGTNYTAQDFDGNVFAGEKSAYLNDLTTGDFQYSVMDLYNIADKEKQTHINSTILNTGTSAIYKYEAWQAWENTADLIQSVQLVEKSAGTLQTYLADSHLVILGAN